MMAHRNFYVGEDIAGQPSIRFAGSPSHWKTCFTWPGAYLGAFWRNLLGWSYTPWSPEKRRWLAWHRQRWEES